MSEKPNIVWITLDSVRHDHTSMSGYERDTTPNIESVADRSDAVSYSACFSHARSSPASVPSMLSGTYPSRHRSYFGNRQTFPGELPLVSELLGEVGYRTVGVSNNGYASSLTGLDRGFEQFTLLGSGPVEILRSAGVRNVLSYVRNIRQHSVGFTTDIHAHSGGYLTTELTKERLQAADEPTFLYVHYNEPHRAYYPPRPYLDRFTDEISMDPSEAAACALRVHHNLLDIVADGCELSDDEMDALVAMYDSEIAYTDSLVGELLETIDATLGETIVVVTADHGELFGERGLLSHKVVVDDALTHVPLVTHGFEGLEARTDDLVQHVDITTTLAGMVGQGTAQLQGVDLRETAREHAFVQRGPLDFSQFTDHDPDFDTARFHHGPLHGIRTKRFRYERSDTMERLYELPDEDTDVREAHPEVTAELSATLDAWVEVNAAPVLAETDSQLDDAMRQQLRDLGYVE